MIYNALLATAPLVVNLLVMFAQVLPVAGPKTFVRLIFTSYQNSAL